MAGRSGTSQGLVTDVHRSAGPEDEAVLGVRVASIQAGGSQKPIQGAVQSTAIEGGTRDSGARTAATVTTGAYVRLEAGFSVTASLEVLHGPRPAPR